MCEAGIFYNTPPTPWRAAEGPHWNAEPSRAMGVHSLGYGSQWGPLTPAGGCNGSTLDRGQEETGKDEQALFLGHTERTGEPHVLGLTY